MGGRDAFTGDLGFDCHGNLILETRGRDLDVHVLRWVGAVPDDESAKTSWVLLGIGMAGASVPETNFVYGTKGGRRPSLASLVHSHPPMRCGPVTRIRDSHGSAWNNSV